MKTYNVCELFEYLLGELKEKNEEITGLQEQNEQLKLEVKFMPDGIGYHEAKTEFDTIADKKD